MEFHSRIKPAIFVHRSHDWVLPVNIAKKRTPIDQISLDFPSYISPDSISGATDSGVPHAVLHTESASSSLLNLQYEALLAGSKLTASEPWNLRRQDNKSKPPSASEQHQQLSQLIQLSLSLPGLFWQSGATMRLGHTSKKSHEVSWGQSPTDSFALSALPKITEFHVWWLCQVIASRDEEHILELYIPANVHKTD